jgi:hydroxymethylglutaryl-CoA synthase
MVTISFTPSVWFSTRSFGSGAGSDAFSLVTTERLSGRSSLAPTTQTYVSRRTEIDYATYTRYRGKLVMK